MAMCDWHYIFQCEKCILASPFESSFAEMILILFRPSNGFITSLFAFEWETKRNNPNLKTMEKATGKHLIVFFLGYHYNLQIKIYESRVHLTSEGI